MTRARRRPSAVSPRRRGRVVGAPCTAVATAAAPVAPAATCGPSSGRPGTGRSTDRRRRRPPHRHFAPGDVGARPPRARATRQPGARRRSPTSRSAGPRSWPLPAERRPPRSRPRCGRSPRRPSRRQRRPPALPRRRPDERAVLARAVGPREHRADAVPRRRRDRGQRRRRHRRPPGARDHDRRPERRSSRSSTTASTSATPTSRRGPGRTRANRAAARRPTASTTTATATSTTSTAGTSATTTTPSTTSTTTSTGPTSPARSPRRSTARAWSGSRRAVKIMALKFLGDDAACGFDSQAIAAIAYAKSFGVRIANTSWGGAAGSSDAPELYDAIASSGMLFVAAAGNDGIDNDARAVPALPASFDLPNILSVAAVDNNGGLAASRTTARRRSTSRRPASTILSAPPGRRTAYPDPGWGWLDGTSMAAPHVTGTAALIASALPSLAADPVALAADCISAGRPLPRPTGLTATGPDGRCVPGARHRSADRRSRADGFGFVERVGRDDAPRSPAARLAGRDRRPVRDRRATHSSRRHGRGRLVRRRLAGTRGQTRTRRSRSGRRTRCGSAPATGPATGGRGRPGRRSSRRIYQETTSLVTYSGSWSTVLEESAASGGQRALRDARPARSVTFHFTGRAFGDRRAAGPVARQRQGLCRRRATSRRSTCIGSSWAPTVVVRRPGRGRRRGRTRSSSWSSGRAGHARFDLDAFVAIAALSARQLPR